jgi:alpha-methylacyl-CoA racemase
MGRVDGPPTFPMNLIGDFGGGGMLLAYGMLAGLLHASRTGEGQVIDAAMVDGAAVLAAFIWGMRAMGVWQLERGTNLLDTGSHFYDAYECADGKHISIGSIEPQFYAELLEKSGLAGEDLPAQMSRADWPAMKERVTALFKTKTRDQ